MTVLPFAPRPTTGTTADRDQAGDLVAIDDPRKVYSVREAATMLGLSLGGTYQLCRAGEIPARKLGNRWVVPKTRFHAWLDNLPEATDADIEQDRIRYERTEQERSR